MSKRYTRNPGSDQVAKWKAALADRHKQQRQQRGRKHEQVLTYQPGMARVAAHASTEGGDGDGHHGDDDHPNDHPGAE